MKRTERSPGCALLVGLPRGLAHAIGVQRYECAEIFVGGGARQQRVCKLLRCDLAGANRLGRFANSKIVKRWHQLTLSNYAQCANAVLASLCICRP